MIIFFKKIIEKYGRITRKNPNVLHNRGRAHNSFTVACRRVWISFVVVVVVDKSPPPSFVIDVAFREVDDRMQAVRDADLLHR